MSLSEFKYICNEYHPSQRRDIINAIQNQHSFLDTKEILAISKQCQQYLKHHHDVPIQNIYRYTQILIELRTKGFQNNQLLNQLARDIWKDLEPMDTWYSSDLKLLGSILFFFDEATLPLIADKIIQSIQKYTHFRETKLFHLSLLSNLSTIYVQRNQLKECEDITRRVHALAKELKRYDIYAFSQVRLGICQKNPELIHKGLALLRATEENRLYASLNAELKTQNLLPQDLPSASFLT